LLKVSFNGGFFISDYLSIITIKTI